MLVFIMVILSVSVTAAAAVVLYRRNEVTQRISNQLSSTADIYISLGHGNRYSDGVTILKWRA